MNETIKLNACPGCQAPIPVGSPQGLCPRCVLGGAAHPTEPAGSATATGEIPSIARIAAAFPQLEIMELIGRGGMGFVFKARQPNLDRFVALKLLPDKLAADAHFAERFNREGRMLARLNHPNIVSVYDFGQTNGFYFLLMEYVDGVNLRQAMRAGRFSPSEALSIVPKICEALQFAHEQGVLHRDIKPENILLDAKGRVKIADFGIAKLVGEDAASFTLTGTGHTLGTPHYMAPEQLEKPNTVDHRADIYSLGVVFYEMLTGELPIGRFSPPSQRTPVDPRVDDVVMRTLEKEREKRFQSAGEMRTSVQHLTEMGAGSFKGVPPKLSDAKGGSAGMTAPDHDSSSNGPAWSQKSVWGAVLVAISLTGPLILAAVMLASHALLGRWEALLALGSISLLPGIAGTILGWMGLSDVNAANRSLRGGGFAAFAALAWPVILLLGLTTWLVVGPVRNFSRTMPFASLLFLVPAGLLTFTLWAVYTTVRRLNGQSPQHRQGALKWIFAATLACALGIGFLSASRKTSTNRAYTTISPNAPTALENGGVPWIGITFTTVELHEVNGTRWLAIDYVDDVHGGGEKAFPWQTTIPGFKAETRASEFVGGGKDSPPVRHQRVEYRMPDSATTDQIEQLRATVDKALKHKSIRLELGEQKLLFEFTTASNASLKAWIKVLPPSSTPSAPATAVASPSAWDQALSSVERVRRQNEEAKKNRAMGNPANSSDEHWTPQLAAGERPDPQKILQEAQHLAQKQRYAEALQRHLWFHNHALEYDPAQSGVRLSFALSAWMELARRHPPARTALVQIRDEGASQFSNTGGYLDLFRDVAAINHQLGQENATYELFKTIHARQPTLARQCYGVAEELLVAKGEYALCESLIPNPQERFASIRAQWEQALARADRRPEANQSFLRNHAEKTFVKETRRLIQILVGVGRRAEAETIGAAAVSALDVPELRSAVGDAEKNLPSDPRGKQL